MWIPVRHVCTDIDQVQYRKMRLGYLRTCVLSVQLVLGRRADRYGLGLSWVDTGK